MPRYKSPEVEDHPLDWVDINHPVNRISLPFYNLALEIHRRRCLIASIAMALVAITIPTLYILTEVHLPCFHWVPKFMRLVFKFTADINVVICDGVVAPRDATCNGGCIHITSPPRQFKTICNLFFDFESSGAG